MPDFMALWLPLMRGTLTKLILARRGAGQTASVDQHERALRPEAAQVDRRAGRSRLENGILGRRPDLDVRRFAAAEVLLDIVAPGGLDVVALAARCEDGPAFFVMSGVGIVVVAIWAWWAVAT
jgi:hypothetical protein